MAISIVLLKVGPPEMLVTTRDWYLRHLPVTTVSEVPGVNCFLSTGSGAKLALHVGEPVDNPERVALYVEVDDVDRLYERMCEAGLVFDVTPETKTDWDGRVMSLRDPVGYLVKPYQRRRRAGSG